MSLRDHDIAESRAHALVELVRPQFPVALAVSGPAEAWILTGSALIARQVGSIEAIFGTRPLGREPDAIVLLRSLYDHAVTFAWLAADPGLDRQRRFLKSDSAARLRVDDDCRRFGIALLTDENRAEHERNVEQLPSKMPPLADRAESADEYWAGRISGIDAADTTHSYRGLYAVAYRRHSAYEHASLMGLNAVGAELPDGRRVVDLERREADSHGPYGLATIIFAFSLFVAAETLGWPGRGRAEGVFEISASPSDPCSG